jgi:NADPH-dependent ferric siderophore reductase
MTWTARVRSVRPLGPHFTRVELGGPGLRSFRTLGTGDEAVTLYFPRPGESAPPPMTVVDGVRGYHGLASAPVGRNYTVRAATDGVMTIDFARHGDGVASTWAERAKPGDGLVIWRQRSWYHPPAGTDWIVLAADATGLPAIARILEQHDSRTPITVLTDFPGALGDLSPRLAGLARSPDGVAARGRDRGVGGLLDQIRDFAPPAGRGYAWFAGECADARRARTLWRDVHGLARDQVASVGYWRAEAADWERRYATVRTEIERLYQDCVDAGESIEDAGELVEAELERRGL